MALTLASWKLSTGLALAFVESLMTSVIDRLATWNLSTGLTLGSWSTILT